MKRKIVDSSKCAGCLNCEAACMASKSAANSVAAVWQEASSSCKPRNKVGAGADGRPLPLFCRHCEKPSCVEACPTGALSKRPDGLVAHDAELCAGCWMCVMSCPYGMAKPDVQAGRMLKCDACEGKDFMACVAACPSGCLKEAEGPGEAVEHLAEGGRK